MPGRGLAATYSTRSRLSCPIKLQHHHYTYEMRSLSVSFGSGAFFLKIITMATKLRTHTKYDRHFGLIVNLEVDWESTCLGLSQCFFFVCCFCHHRISYLRDTWAYHDAKNIKLPTYIKFIFIFIIQLPKQPNNHSSVETWPG